MSKNEEDKISKMPTYEELLKNPKLIQELLKKEPRVGYRRPPTGAQFKPGQSGNPKGRPKGSKNLRASLEKIFTKPVTVRRGDRTQKVTSLEAVIMTNISKALKGDPRSIETIYKMGKELGLFNQRPIRVIIDEDLSHFTREELEELKRLCEKANARTVPV